MGDLSNVKIGDLMGFNNFDHLDTTYLLSPLSLAMQWDLLGFRFSRIYNQQLVRGYTYSDDVIG